ncbi:MAG: hypothetical protein WA160_11585 [Pseudobdellovibrio sp.]
MTATYYKFLQLLLSIAVSCGALVGCVSKSNTELAKGTVSVQIPVQEKADSYQLKTIELLGIQNLREVAGDFVRFFYAPGSAGHEITGQAPAAHFIKIGSVFIPSDYTSIQMATIYYHMQNLAAFDTQVGAAGINQWPRSVGLEAQVAEGEGIQTNNAFYDGQTDSMMFVPFTNTDLPISVNAGIIAHEHFHSLFYKIVLKSAIALKKVSAKLAFIHSSQLVKVNIDKMQVQKDQITLLNELYLRGINEGMADFWGWVYTEDVDFMKWSLPTYVSARSLTLDKADIGYHITKVRMLNMIDNASFSDDLHGALAAYSYDIGTPHAKFLKQLANIYANENNVSISIAKIKIAKQVFQFLNDLKINFSALKDDESISELSLFRYFADQMIKNNTLTEDSCQFLIEYLNFTGTNSADKTNESKAFPKQKCSLKDGKVLMTNDVETK